MTPAYSNSRIGRLRVLQSGLWIVVGLAALATGAAVSRDGFQGIATVGLVLGPAFASIAIIIETYLRCYVSRIDPVADGLRIETLTTFGRSARTFPPEALGAGRERHGFLLVPGKPLVDNTSLILRVSGRLLPLIIDTTNDPLDPTLFGTRP